jgi:hypothetical protein
LLSGFHVRDRRRNYERGAQEFGHCEAANNFDRRSTEEMKPERVTLLSDRRNAETERYCAPIHSL